MDFVEIMQNTGIPCIFITITVIDLVSETIESSWRENTQNIFFSSKIPHPLHISLPDSHLQNNFMTGWIRIWLVRTGKSEKRKIPYPRGNTFEFLSSSYSSSSRTGFWIQQKVSENLKLVMRNHKKRLPPSLLFPAPPPKFFRFQIVGLCPENGNLLWKVGKTDVEGESSWASRGTREISWHEGNFLDDKY